MNAVEKWTLTAHLKAAVRNNFQSLCDLASHKSDKSFSPKAISDEETSVRKVYDTIMKYSNPFFVSPCDRKIPLKNIISGHIVAGDFTNEVINALDIGKKATDQFVKARFVEKTTPFFEKIKKMNLHTFSDENKPLKVSRKKEPAAILKDDKVLFSRLLTASVQRDIDLKAVLSYELSAVPLSLFHPTGEMRKTVKSQLLKELESMSSPTENIDGGMLSSSASVIDFMAMLQSLNKSDLETFDDLFYRIQNVVLAVLKESRIIAIVPDRYDIRDSIKAEERIRRTGQSLTQVIDINGPTKLPKNIPKYLSSSANKTNLVEYCFRRWKQSLSKTLSREEIVYLAELNGNTTKITMRESLPTTLICDHEEADSKMLVFCKMIKECHQAERIVIHSPDTDVAVIACYHQLATLSMKELWFKTGIGKNKRFIPIHDIVFQLDQRICKLLLAFHSITGCDSVSSFAGIGKKSALASLKKQLNNLDELEDFGNEPALSLNDDAVVACIRFVCSLYDKSSNDEFNINEVRYKLFTKKSLSGEKLPPTLDALTLHLKRANYQAFIWKHSCQPLLSLPSPIGNGWMRDENNMMQHEMMSNKPVPDVVAELTHCTCKKGCQTNQCRCRKSNLQCMEACLCHDTCKNIRHEEDFDEDDEDEVTDYDKE